MPDFAMELKHVVRRLLRSPGFAAITLVTLALGIGANTAIYSVVNGVILKPLPFHEPERLVAIWQSTPMLNLKDLNASPATYFTYREEGRVFEDVGLWRGSSVTVTGLAEPERIQGLVVTDGVLPMLRVQPARGRWFSKAEDQPNAPQTAMLNHGYWLRRFGGDPSIVGKKITIDGTPREIIGVLPEGFRFMWVKPEVVLPFNFDRAKTFIGNFSYQCVARLKPGVTLDQANADVGRMIPMLTRKFPPAPGMSPKMIEEARLGPSVRPLKKDLIGDVGKVLWVLMGTVGIVLLIACANVANLLLVRAEGRQQELAIRAALGASWAQIARELLIESMALGIAGGALGVGIAYWALKLLVYLAPANLPRLSEIAIDSSVLLFTLVVSVFAGALFGMIPVFKYAGARLGTALRQGGRTLSEGRERHRARSTLVVVQVALALVLLISSGLMIRTLRALRNVEPGFRAPEDVLTLRIAVPEAEVPKPERVVRIYNDVVDRIKTISGVTSVALTTSVTMDGNDSNDPLYAEDRVYSEATLPTIRRYKWISPGLFSTMGRSVLAGREISWTDVHEARPVVMITENLARELWQQPANAIGKRVRESPKGVWREVIGVVADEHDNGVHLPAPTVVYWPIMVKEFWGNAVNVQRGLAVTVRSPRANSPEFLKEVQQAVWSVNASVPVANVRTLEEIYTRSMARTSFTLLMVSLASGLALVLGIVGIYGVISYSVSQRTREIGIRMALGAQHSQVTNMFLKHGLKLTGVGAVCGLVAAVSASRLMASLLYNVSPLDPITYVTVPVILLAAAMAATYIPARRATGIDPSEALRAE